MSEFIVCAMIVAAIAIQVWKRTSAKTQAFIIERAKHMIRQIGRYAEALKNRAFL